MMRMPALMAGTVLLASPLVPSCEAAPAASIRPQEGKDLPADRPDILRQAKADLETADARMRAHPDSLGPRLDRLRILFVLGVREESYLAEADKDIDSLRERRDAGPEQANLLRAYRGAVRVVHAKHGLNPLRKREYLRAGLPILDSSVAFSPDQPEIRYLRLVSGYYLPFFIGRKTQVKQDFAALARLLPDRVRDYPPKWFLSVAGFVLDKGRLDPARKTVLRKSMDQATAAAANATRSGKG